MTKEIRSLLLSMMKIQFWPPTILVDLGPAGGREGGYVVYEDILQRLTRLHAQRLDVGLMSGRRPFPG